MGLDVPEENQFPHHQPSASGKDTQNTDLPGPSLGMQRGLRSRHLPRDPRERTEVLLGPCLRSFVHKVHLDPRPLERPRRIGHSPALGVGTPVGGHHEAALVRSVVSAGRCRGHTRAARGLLAWAGSVSRPEREPAFQAGGKNCERLEGSNEGAWGGGGPGRGQAVRDVPQRALQQGAADGC